MPPIDRFLVILLARIIHASKVILEGNLLDDINYLFVDNSFVYWVMLELFIQVFAFTSIDSLNCLYRL